MAFMILENLAMDKKENFSVHPQSLLKTDR